MLDFGTVKGENGFIFKGHFLRVARDEAESMIVLDSGDLTYPNGKTYSGEFTLATAKKLEYLRVPPKNEAGYLLTREPHLFRGTILSDSRSSSA